MNPDDLLKQAYLTPLWRSGALALLLWIAVWWRERPAKSPLPLAVMALAWAGCHVLVHSHAKQFPPKFSEDWLFFGACGALVTAVTAAILRRRPLPLGTLTALLLLSAAWLAFGQLPYLLDRGETSDERLLRTGIGGAAVLLAFGSAEWCARRVSPAALLLGLACFAGLAGISLLRLKSPEFSVARPFAAGGIAVAGALAAWLRRGFAAIPRGLAGWFAGGTLVLVIFGCLSRATQVPLEPMAAAAGVLPFAALVLTLHRRFFIAGHGLTFVAAMLAGSSGILLTAARNQNAFEAAPPPVEATGADDTGAYD